MIGLGIRSGSQSAQVYPTPHSQCVIQEFNSYHCHCTAQSEVDCDGIQQDIDFFQYMYYAISNETCGTHLIKSTKDECEMLNAKDTPYGIGSQFACHIEDCDGFFVFQQINDMQTDINAQIFVGLGISLILIAGFCCIAALISGSTCYYRSG
eukprot:UN03634